MGNKQWIADVISLTQINKQMIEQYVTWEKFVGLTYIEQDTLLLEIANKLIENTKQELSIYAKTSLLNNY